jgi:hypothetical protein
MLHSPASVGRTVVPGMPEDKQDKLTVGRILHDLEPSQLWGLLVAIATIVSASFFAGNQFPRSGAVVQSSSSPISCSAVSGWPKGRWWTWGRLETPPTKKNTDNWTRIPQISSELVFTSSHSYEVQTEQLTQDATKRIYEATSEEPLIAGSTVRFHGKDGTGYESKSTITASDDGCMLHGEFTDTDGNAGTLHFLYQSPRYYVSPK